jgi:hypothetical protein
MTQDRPLVTADKEDFSVAAMAHTPSTFRQREAINNIAPRGLTREQAARYAGCETLSAFANWVRRGILPGPIPGTHRWDKRAIDAALDRASGLQTTLAPSALEEWKARRARSSQGRS